MENVNTSSKPSENLIKRELDKNENTRKEFRLPKSKRNVNGKSERRECIQHNEELTIRNIIRSNWLNIKSSIVKAPKSEQIRVDTQWNGQVYYWIVQHMYTKDYRLILISTFFSIHFDWFDGFRILKRLEISIHQASLFWRYLLFRICIEQYQRVASIVSRLYAIGVVIIEDVDFKIYRQWINQLVWLILDIL